MTYTHEDVPWTIETLTTNIILNPDDIPSEITIRIFTESIMHKVVAYMGKEGDGTLFIDVTIIVSIVS